MTARTEEHGGPVSVWRHHITVEPAGPASSRYTDEVEVGAGRLTGLVGGLASGFLRWRQHRWRQLARRWPRPRPPDEPEGGPRWR